MKPILQKDGSLLVPFRAEGPNGLIGDGMRRVTSDDAEYEKLRKEAEQDER